MERVEIARHNRATGRGWYESAPFPLGSEPPSEEGGQDPTPAEATGQHAQRRGPGRPRKSNKRPRTEENLEPNSVMADTQPKLRQTPRAKLCSSGRAFTSSLEREPSALQAVASLQEHSDRLEADAKAIPSIIVKNLAMSKASITPLKTQWKKTTIINGY